MRWNGRLAATFAVACLALSSLSTAWAQCALPNTLTNGQTADATQVMANFNALLSCINNAAPAGSTNALQYKASATSFGGVAPLTNGQLVIGSTGNAPQAATLTGGPGVTITNGAGSITIAGGNGTPPTLVQSAFTKVTSGSSGTVTLTSAPTVGNLLVAIASGFPTSLAVPSPFNNVFSALGNIVNNEGIVVGAHVVQTGDGTTWPGFTGNAGTLVFGIFELSGAHGIQVYSSQGRQSGSAWPFFAGSAANAYTFFVLENDSTNTFSSIAGATLLFDGTGSANNHPSVISTVATASVLNASVTYTGTGFGASLSTIVAVTQ